MSDKSNALPSGHSIWQRVFWELAKQYPNIEATHLYIDALSMQMVKNPGQFQVVVTNNMFGDIVTDLGAQLQGGLGLAASGNTHPGRTSMFEPVHGSAPKYAGKNVANPIGAILSAALMLEFLGLPEAAASVEAAVKKSVVNGEGTAEVGGTLGTKEAGDVITKYILQGS
jgi:3-isopropylmalate dehydrogenase